MELPYLSIGDILRIENNKFIALVNKYTDFSELTTPMINEFVDMRGHRKLKST